MKINDSISEQARSFIELIVEDVEIQNISEVLVSKNTLEELDLISGDVIEIFGSKLTTAKAMEDVNLISKDTIKMDQYMQQNAGVEVGSKIKLMQANYREAEYILFSPLKNNISIEYGFDVYVKNGLDMVPITLNDIIVLPILGKNLQFVVTDCSPDGILLITKNTKVKVSKLIAS